MFVLLFMEMPLLILYSRNKLKLMHMHHHLRKYIKLSGQQNTSFFTNKNSSDLRTFPAVSYSIHAPQNSNSSNQHNWIIINDVLGNEKMNTNIIHLQLYSIIPLPERQAVSQYSTRSLIFSKTRTTFGADSVTYTIDKVINYNGKVLQYISTGISLLRLNCRIELEFFRRQH